ncbi:ATP-binding protein [Guyparkeria sp. 1SP6A2]|nr:ATP-binding protein [Guyparkeria sp. 1SP6A2]
MKLRKEDHEAFAKFFEKPTRDKFRDLISQNIGETNHLDYKEQWPEFNKVARHILALANSGGGALVFGIKEAEGGSLESTGLTEFKDKADVGKSLRKYVPGTVDYDIFDFEFNGSEYKPIEGKRFQVVLVEYEPTRLPFVALKGSKDLKDNIVYVRSGTESLEANHEQLERLINERIETGYSSSKEMDLSEHLEQLKILYKSARAARGFGLVVPGQVFNSFFGGDFEEYYDFIDVLIEDKKRAIRDELGV